MSTPPFTVRAVFEYTSDHDDDLNFPIGQIVTVTAIEDDEWYCGEYADDSGGKREGIFPKNFVEKYEPPAPPRPSRPSRPKRESDGPSSEQAVETPVAETKPEPAPEPEPEPEPESTEPPAPAPAPEPEPVSAGQPESPPMAPGTSTAAESPTSPKPEPTPAPAPAAAEPAPKPSKPPVAEKPTGSSFKDRIAAFNKPAAPPIAPFKPGGNKPQDTSSFIKKPFVAPPPSKNAYVPPPREAPPKFYKREEDPEMQERAAAEPPSSESQPLMSDQPEGPGEKAPQTSLKDRIASLQKQQQEQAARHAEAAQKKEKPPKPPSRQPTQSLEETAPVEEPEPEKSEPAETTRNASADTLKAAAPPVPQPSSPPPVSQEMASDTNDADYSAAADTEEETSTSKEDIEERSRPETRRQSTQGTGQKQEEAEEGEGGGEDTEGEETDPEVRRKMELRERMAKMSGGMGMMGFLGGPMPGAGARKPKASTEEEKPADESEKPAPANAPPVPVAVPGMAPGKMPGASKDVEKEDESETTSITEERPPEEVPDVEEAVHEEPPSRASGDRPPPPIPQERGAPPPPPRETRPVPPPVPQGQAAAPPVPGPRPVPAPPTKSPGSGDPGEESDDELSVHAKNLSLNAAAADQSPAVSAPPLPEHIDSRRPSAYEGPPPKSPPERSDKRYSRPPPPIPTSPPATGQTRAPPPPPPMGPRRRSTTDSKTSGVSSTRQAGEEVEGEVTEYDGDYDTDIASGAKHKDALKAHGRDSSIDEGTITDSPRSPDSRAPAPPSAPRGVPPPPPSQPPKGRSSLESPRGPPPPRPNMELPQADDDEYDPFRYSAPQHGLPVPPPIPAGRPEGTASHPAQPEGDESDDMYDASPIQTPVEQPPTPSYEKRGSIPPPLPSQAPSGPPPPAPQASRTSMDTTRSQNMRRSVDISRATADQGLIAGEVDLAEDTLWWKSPNTPPPVFQNRKDILFEIEESTSAKRGGKTVVSKDVYVLFIDYSQNIITVRYDAKNPSDASFEQRQEGPPLQPRQDQLEDAHQQLGARISNAVNEIQNTTVGDGSPFALVRHLLNPLTEALLPVGTRAYGALVYSNLANASVQQHDEIRPGDIVSVRNARFQGHRGAMHQKYSAEVGKPDHVGIVVDWDGTKKKIRAWEQGRESKKVKMESLRLNDLRSGECKVWRVMPRSWVGWEG